MGFPEGWVLDNGADNERRRRASVLYDWQHVVKRLRYFGRYAGPGSWFDKAADIIERLKADEAEVRAEREATLKQAEATGVEFRKLTAAWEGRINREWALTCERDGVKRQLTRAMAALEERTKERDHAQKGWQVVARILRMYREGTG